MKEPRKTGKRVWTWVVILTAIVCLYPVEYQITRVAVFVGLTVTWTGALPLWWQRRAVRFVLLLLLAALVLAVCLPGRSVDPEALAADYSRGLRIFRGTRYVWGGEGFLGMDCSGLVRKGLVWGQLLHGVRTVNGSPIRSAIQLWWHDCSASALREGYRGWTTELFRDDTIAAADLSKLRPGDLAVTADGVHVMAYLGEKRWIAADPDAGRVIEVVLPTNNQWFKTPVVFVRWKWLSAPRSPTQAGRPTGAALLAPVAASRSCSALASRGPIRRSRTVPGPTSRPALDVGVPLCFPGEVTGAFATGD